MIRETGDTGCCCQRTRRFFAQKLLATFVALSLCISSDLVPDCFQFSLYLVMIYHLVTRKTRNSSQVRRSCFSTLCFPSFSLVLSAVPSIFHHMLLNVVLNRIRFLKFRFLSLSDSQRTWLEKAPKCFWPSIHGKRQQPDLERIQLLFKIDLWCLNREKLICTPTNLVLILWTRFF